MGQDSKHTPEPWAFAWVDPAGAKWLRLEVQAQDGSGGTLLSALVPMGRGQYDPPPWFVNNHRGQPLRWRVLALESHGQVLGQSAWRALSMR